jgi:biotin carboxylase
MSKVLIVFPTAWDRKQLPAEACARGDVVFAEPSDHDCPADFDPIAFVDRIVQEHGGSIDGVFSSSDYPGATLAGAIATRMGLPGSPPDRLIRCAHKFYSRQVQQAAVPEATPEFWPVNPRQPAPPPFGFPCFVKPVKGAFSMLARKVVSAQDLAAFLGRQAVTEFTENYLGIFNRLVREFTDFEQDGRWFVAERLIGGAQVTVEGFAAGGRVEILGHVDSEFHPGRGSFRRFLYPSVLPTHVQARISEKCRRLVRALGLEQVMWNIEWFHDAAADRDWIIEINARMCGQFSDLYEKVDGASGRLVD